MHAKTVAQLVFVLIAGIVLFALASVAFRVWDEFNAHQSFRANDAASITRYKNWINQNDLLMVGGKIKPSDLPAAYCRVIEYDVQNGDLESARRFIGQTIQKKLDDQVMGLVHVPGARELISHMQNAQRKVELLNQFVAETEKGSTPSDTRKAADAERARLAREFCQVPFDAKACPEAAEEIFQTYRSKLAPRKDKDKIVQQVAQEVETKCLLLAPAK
jgi:hypothetical protein